MSRPSCRLYETRFCNHNCAVIVGILGPYAAKRVGEAIAHMKANLDRPLRFADLAAIANLSASHFAALFKRHTGYPAYDYFLRLKLQEASALLDTTSLSVKEIAGRLGFGDSFYFSRLFKSVYGLSPRRHRETAKG